MKEKKIYLLEDDEDIRELMKYLLTRSGYQVFSFSKARDFYEKLTKELPDLFILDVSLPDGNGLDISQTLLSGKNTERIPVLLMSANLHNQEKAIDSGINDFISKPFDIDDLLKKVKSLITV
ncbi:MAG: response regulator [Bacteroidota bacterium]